MNALTMAVLICCGVTALASPAEPAVAMIVAESVDINSADAATLERVLKGVGRSRAEAIVAYREANGRFYAAEELTAVKGIGAATVARNADRIRWPSG